MQLDNKVLIEQIEELARILNKWNEQIVVGGGVALVLYDLLLSKANSGAVGTTDIDLLIPRKLVKTGDEQIYKILISHGYEPKTKSINHPSVECYIKQIDDFEIEIEFLTDNKSRKKEDVVVIKDAGVNAQALSYIEMSLQEITPLSLPSGKIITVVKPEAWVFHKGLTFVKRANEAKKHKDLYGIWFVLSQLGNTSLAIQKALPKLMTKNSSSWARTFKENLNKWIENSSPKDWQLLESQDVGGKLTRIGFEGVVKKLLN